MCGRFVLKATPAELITRFGLDECVDLTPRYNIPPGTEIAAIRLSPEGQVLCGLVGVTGGEGVRYMLPAKPITAREVKKDKSLSQHTSHHNKNAQELSR
jgi:putative SOS response-associated peptidase YedK